MRASEEAFEPASIGCASHAFSGFRSVYKAQKRTFEGRQRKLNSSQKWRAESRKERLAEEKAERRPTGRAWNRRSLSCAGLAAWLAQNSNLRPQTSDLRPQTSHLTPRWSRFLASWSLFLTGWSRFLSSWSLTPGTSHLTPCTSHLTPRTSHLTTHD